MDFCQARRDRPQGHDNQGHGIDRPLDSGLFRLAGRGLAQAPAHGPRTLVVPAAGLFPNWQFFHGLGPAPRLWVRSQNTVDHWSKWQLVDPRLPRQAWHLLHNPSVNLALSHQNLVEHLASDVHDLAENADIRDCVSYQLVTRLARDAVQGGCWGDTPMVQQPDGFAPKAFQFEVRLLRLGQPGDAQLLLSPVMRLHP